MRQKVREIACPVCLRKRLRAFRVETAGRRSYLLTDPLQNQTFEFEPWQFFVLEVLPECDSFARLSLLVEDRYGQPTTQEEVDRLLAMLLEKRLFGNSARSTSILIDFDRRMPEILKMAPDDGAEIENAPLPAAVSHALSLDRQKATKGRELFDPSGLLSVIHLLVAPFRHAIYLLPLLLIPATIIAFRYHHEFADDLLNWFGRISLLWHAVLGLVTVNLLVTTATALVAYHFGVTVSAFCIVFYFAVWPRFLVRVGSVQELPRRARVWYYAAPLLMRLSLFSIAMLVWFNTRQMEGVLAKFSAAIAVITQFSFLIAAIPLRQSNGYWLLATLLDAPRLRERATHALHNRLRGRSNERADDGLLAIYAFASTLFIVAVIAVFFLLLGRSLETHFSGGLVVLALAIVAAVLCIRIANKVKKVSLANARATKFAAWRDRGARKAD